MNLANKPALGLWVHGDNSGALLNLQVLSAAHTGAGGMGDHYITLDFSGWRYFALVEFESERISELGWPYGHHAYSTYREHVDFGAVESFSLWYNNLPPAGAAACVLSPVKALPLVEAPVRNPVLTVNGVSIKFPVEIPCGASVEFQDMNTCILYGKKGEELARVTPEGGPLVLEPGDNQISFACDANPEAPARARVTIGTFGEPLTGE